MLFSLEKFDVSESAYYIGNWQYFVIGYHENIWFPNAGKILTVYIILKERSWINSKQKKNKKKTKTKNKKKEQKTKNKNKSKRQKHNQSKNNYTHCDFPGYSKCGKNILWLFSCYFFFYRRNTYLRYYIEHRHYININSIQSMISKKSWT